MTESPRHRHRWRLQRCSGAAEPRTVELGGDGAGWSELGAVRPIDVDPVGLDWGGTLVGWRPSHLGWGGTGYPLRRWDWGGCQEGPVVPNLRRYGWIPRER